MKKLYKLLIFSGLLGLLILSPKLVHAQGPDTDVEITTDSSNDVLLNGQENLTYYFDSGTSVNFNIANDTTNDSFYLCGTGLSQPLPPGSGYTLSTVANAEPEFSVVLSSSACNDSSGNPAYLWVDGATGSLSCALSDNMNWEISGNYSYVPQFIELYEGSTYITEIPAHSGSPNSFNTTVAEQFRAETSASTYYLYDGTSDTDALIGQVTCPASQAVAPTSTSSKPANTSRSSNSSNTATTNTSTKAKTGSTSAKNDKATKPVVKSNVKKVSGSNTGLYISGGVILLVVAALLVLDFLKIWTKPKQLLVKGWKRFRAIHRQPENKKPKTD